MPNPYGMTEVDIPGILAQFEQRNDRRMQQLLAQRQMTQMDQQIERENKTAAAWSKFLGPQGGVGGAYGQPGAPQTPEAPGGSQAPPEASQAADYDPWTDDAAQAELVQSLAVVAPEDAMKIREAFSQHTEAERKQAAENWARIGQTALQLRQLPPQERAAELQRQTPMLVSLGIAPEMLAQVDLSDRGLESYVEHARDIEQVIGGRTARTIPVQAGGEIRTVMPGQPYPDFGGGTTPIPPEAIEALRRGEGTPEQFDEAFGPGASQRVMTDPPQVGANGQPQVLTRAQYQAVVATKGQAATDAWMQRNNIRVDGGPASAPGNFR